jgi:hypothetical protein
MPRAHAGRFLFVVELAKRKCKCLEAAAEDADLKRVLQVLSRFV